VAAELAIDRFFVETSVAAIAAGGSMGLLGVYLVGMRMPLSALAISHAAMVGAIFGPLAGVHWLPSALAAAVVSASLAIFRPEAGRLDPTSGLAVVFGLMMGLIFLGMSLGGMRALPLLWGNLLAVYGVTLYAIIASAVGVAAFALVFAKELRAVLFSRFLAGASGVHEGLVTTLLLALTGLVVTVNISAVGGLMIYALVCIPAAAAFQIAASYRGALAAATAIGAASALGGFAASLWLDTPTGASIVLAAVAFYLAAAGWRRLVGRRD
jgi:ABC-type Mn2+/Zn2+ transport system permease subunit